MKAFILLLFISLVSLYNSLEPTITCQNITNPENQTVCYDAMVEAGYFKCCYEFYNQESSSYLSCLPLTEENFTNIEEFKKQRKSEIGNVNNYTLECESSPVPPTTTPSNSKYISLSLLSLIMLLL